MTLRKTTIIHFVGGGGFSVTYSNGHKKLTHCTVFNFLDYLHNNNTPSKNKYTSK